MRERHGTSLTVCPFWLLNLLNVRIRHCPRDSFIGEATWLCRHVVRSMASHSSSISYGVRYRYCECQHHRLSDRRITWVSQVDRLGGTVRYNNPTPWNAYFIILTGLSLGIGCKVSITFFICTWAHFLIGVLFFGNMYDLVKLNEKAGYFINGVYVLFVDSWIRICTMGWTYLFSI